MKIDGNWSIKALLTLVTAASTLMALPAQAGNVLSNGVGSTTGGSAQDPGISLLMPTGPTGWTQLSFNFYQNFDGAQPGAEYAIGNLFVLTQQYLGTPQALGSATPGFLAQAQGNGSQYVLDPAITLLSNTSYYFYADLGLENGAFTHISDTNTPLPGSQSYGAANGTQPYLNRPFAISFALNGTPTIPAVPEPSTLALSSLAMLSLIVVRRRLGAPKA